MKMDFHARAFVILCFTLLTVACGRSSSPSGTFEKASDPCLSNAIEGSFVVKFKDGRVQRVKAPSKQEFLDGFVTENLEQIAFTEHDFRVKPFEHEQIAAPNFFDENEDMIDNWGVSRIRADTLWNQGVRGSGVIVAVIDTGVDIDHPQLKNQILTNPAELGLDSQGRDRATNGVDDDSNGFVDDAYGFNFVKNRGLTGDNTYHGTHVAGIVAAQHADVAAGQKTYVQGTAPGAKILPLAFMDANGGTMIDGARAIDYAVMRGARVINASWGGGACSRVLKDTIAGLAAKDVVFVAAAGNSGANIDRNPSYPASLSNPTQVTVGATGWHNHTAEFSNYGQAVHIFAPGDDIISTVPTSKGSYASLRGTSMAAPYIAGAIALLLSAEPTATSIHVRQAIYNSSVRNSDYFNASQGRLDLSSTLAELRRLMAQ